MSEEKTIEKRRKISVHIDGEKKPVEIIVPNETSAKDMCSKMIVEGLAYMEESKLVFIPSRRISKAVVEVFHQVKEQTKAEK